MEKITKKRKTNGAKKDVLKSSTLWKVQYAPMEKIIKSTLSSAQLKKWNALTTTRKIEAIDKLERKGAFDKLRKSLESSIRD